MKNRFVKFNKVPLLISIIFFALSFGAFMFLYAQIEDNHKTSEESEIAWRNENNRRDEMESLDRLLKLIEEERTLLETHFIKSSDVAYFLDKIESLAPNAGAKAEVSLVDLAKDGSALVVEVKASGSFEAIYKFLTLLENSPYELEFFSIDIQKLGEQEDPEKKTITVTWAATFKLKLLSFIK